MSERRPPHLSQLELPFDGGNAGGGRRPPKLRVIEGGGARTQEPLVSRDAVARVMMEAGADMLLRRISPERAEEIEQRVDRIFDLFDAVDRQPSLRERLSAELDELESLMRETRETRIRRRG